MKSAVDHHLVERVILLSDYFNIKQKDRDDAIEIARRVIELPKPEGMDDVAVEIRRQVFPLRERYGLAVEAFRNLIMAHQKVDDELDSDRRRIHNMLGADRSEKRLQWAAGVPQTDLFRFFPMGPLTQLQVTPKTSLKRLKPERFTLTCWQNLCLYVTDPTDFLEKAVVAVSDRVENGTPHNYRHAPVLRGSRTKLTMTSVSIDQVQLQRYPLYHREGQCFKHAL